MPIEVQSDLFAALTRSDADALLGTAESNWLDFKRTPYRFDLGDASYQRLELVKDVTALANSGGGVIVVGYETQPDATTGQDVAIGWKRIPQALVDPNQYRSIVEGQTYPPFRDISMRWWLEDAGAAILTIEAKAAQEQDRPIIVMRVQEEGLNRALLMGIFERAGDRSGAVLPSQMHAQLRLGRLIERGALLNLGPARSTPEGPAAEERKERLEADTMDGDFEERRRLYLQAWPQSATVAQDIHAEQFRRLFSLPAGVREHGFGLRTGVEPSTLPGGGLRTQSRRQSLSLQRNGLLTWVAAADSDFLAWADERRGQPHLLNQLALVEATLEFARLYVSQVLPRFEPPVGQWAIDGGMSNLRSADGVSVLPGGQLDEFDLPLNVWGYEPRAAPADQFRFGPLDFSDQAPGVIALTVLREIYSNFGLPEKAIPYTDATAVDPTKFPPT